MYVLVCWFKRHCLDALDAPWLQSLVQNARLCCCCCRHPLPVGLQHRIHSLRVSQLPRLRGTLLPNPCLLLRMLLLHHQLSSRHRLKHGRSDQQDSTTQSPHSAYAQPSPAWKPPSSATGYQLASATSSLLTLAAEPFLAAADPAARQQLDHMTEFGLAYLASSHLIDASGRPVGLAGLVSHLFWTEPANFALVRLLSSGVVHQLVAELKAAGRGQQQLQEALLLLVAGLFEVVPLHPLEAQRWQGSRRNESPSVVCINSLIVSAHVANNNVVFVDLERCFPNSMLVGIVYCSSSYCHH